MEAILALIIEYASIWAPSIVSILGVITTVLLAIGKTKNAIDEMKNGDGALRAELTEVKNQLKLQASENEILIQAEKDLVDKLSTIKNYTNGSRGDHTDD